MNYACHTHIYMQNKSQFMMKQSYHDTEYFSGTINFIRLAVFLVHIRGRGASNITSYIKSTLLSKKDVYITTFMGLQRFNATKNKLVQRFGVNSVITRS